MRGNIILYFFEVYWSTYSLFSLNNFQSIQISDKSRTWSALNAFDFIKKKRNEKKKIFKLHKNVENKERRVKYQKKMEKLLLYKHRHTNSGGGKSKTAALAIALDQLKRLLHFFFGKKTLWIFPFIYFQLFLFILSHRALFLL